MSSSAYTRIHRNHTPQSAPIPGREAEMMPNNAGGYGFQLGDWDRLDRFLLCGSEGGTYYVDEQQLTEQNTQVVIRCLKENGERVINNVVDCNLNNRSPKVDQHLYVLALAMKYGDHNTKVMVHAVAPHVLRTGTHLLRFVAMIDSLRGWGRSAKDLIKPWFERAYPDELAYQVVKYASRDGWSMRDVLRTVHPKATTPAHAALYDWICKRDSGPMPDMPRIVQVHRNMWEQLGTGGTYQEAALCAIEAGLPMEAVPKEALQDSIVWAALVPRMPPHALLRNLGTLTANRVLSNPTSLDLVLNKLRDKDAMQRARVHPFAILLAKLVYESGGGIRSDKRWSPETAVVQVLHDAFTDAVNAVRPTGRRLCIAVDMSQSMTYETCAGLPMSPDVVSSALAQTLALYEPYASAVLFDTRVFYEDTLRTEVAQTLSKFRRSGGTDLAAPIVWATRKQRVFDAFVVLTDSETWVGKTHPAQALQAYRREVCAHARLVCCSMAANHANIVDPQDVLSLGCSGVDANLASIVAEFVQ